MKKELLPIGTVVLLKTSTKPIMVIGFLPKPKDNQDTKEYDYSACLYPEGLVDSNTILLFNNEDIDKILFEGFKCSLDDDFKKEINNLLNNK